MSLERTEAQIAIIGGGIAGSTIALRLAELGQAVDLYEKGPSLVNGPPVCHLHAGGNFYREISDQQCQALLEQSLATMKIYPQAINKRPTVVATPNSDPGQPQDLLPRLAMLQQHYQSLIDQDPSQALLGPASEYYRLYDREQMQRLAAADLPPKAKSLDDWMIPLAKQLDLDAFKYPMILVQEYGLSIFRVAATVSLALNHLPKARVMTCSPVEQLKRQGQGWLLSSRHGQRYYDYVVNAAGFRSGTIDDLVQLPRPRMLEFKAAYVVRWPECQGQWPEVLFHGPRGTHAGMAQLTPYPNRVFQLHGMTQEITLFKDGLVHSTQGSSQPQLAAPFMKKLESGWLQAEVDERSQRAIDHMAQHLPAFASAQVAGKPMFGAQQIPGDEPSLRASEISFTDANYARAEIVKSCTAIQVANDLVAELVRLELIAQRPLADAFRSTQGLSIESVEKRALELSSARHYLAELARKAS